MNSIGRGANLLVNMTPDTSGLLSKVEVERLNDFGRLLDETFQYLVGSADVLQENAKNEVFINLSEASPVNLLVIEEDIKYGQHVRHLKLRLMSMAVGIRLLREKV